MATKVFVRESISIAELTRLAEGRFGDLVQAVVDVGRDVLVVGADMHADQEAALLADGAQQADLWGVNLHPAAAGTADSTRWSERYHTDRRSTRCAKCLDTLPEQ